MGPIVSAAAGFGGGRGRRGAGEASRRHRVGAACTAVVFTALLWFLVAALLAGHAGGSTARATEDSWTPGRFGVSSSFANAPPVIDGIAAIGEWADATTVPLENGRLRLQHDAVNLYLLLDVTADLSSGPGDYFWLVFDENRDGAITAGVDSCYTIRQVSPGALGLGVQLFSGPGAWGPATACDSRAKAGFGESAALEYPHRVWEFAISLAEVQAAAGGSVRLGIRAASEADGYMEEYPAALFVDFSGLLQVNLPAPIVDLLVLTDQAFTAALVPFKEHKDIAGIGTYVQTWQDVDDALANDGADPPERIKRAIARYVEACGTRYVMLVGDSNHFPVRYFMTDRDTPAAFDRAFYPTDYYYADLYTATGAFNDWDANNDGYYAELHGETIAGPMNIDGVDVTPDVAVGRIPADTAAEVSAYVDKVVAYDKAAYGADWSRRALLAATTEPSAAAPAKTETIADALGGFSITRLYTNPNPAGVVTPPVTPTNIQRSLHDGVALASYMGHGNEFGLTVSGFYGSTALEGMFDDGAAWYYDLGTHGEELVTGDFNGDGRTDVAELARGGTAGTPAGHVRVALSTGTSFAATTLWDDDFAPGGEVVRVGDANGDGRDDLIAFARNALGWDARGEVYVALSAGTGFGPETEWHDYFCIGDETPVVGDFNGDGRDDIATLVGDTKDPPGINDVYVALSTGASFGESEQWHDWFGTSGELVRVGDFDGDGRDDMAAFVRSSRPGGQEGDVWVTRSTGTSFSATSLWNAYLCIDGELPEVGDFNGDGMADVVTFIHDTKPNDRAVVVSLSTGTKFAAVAGWQTDFCAQHEVPGVGDVDGDGRADILSFLGSSGSGVTVGDVKVAVTLALPGNGILPVFFASACDTARFATLPPYDPYTDASGVHHAGTTAKEVFTSVPPMPSWLQTQNDPGGFGEEMILAADKGAIAYVGCVAGGQDWGDDLDVAFFTAYKNGSRAVGDLMAEAVRLYYVQHPIPASLPVPNWGLGAMVHQPWKFILFGDPSVRVGGMPGTPRSAFLGKYDMVHDNWEGTLSLTAAEGDPVEGVGNVGGTYTGTDGVTHAVQGFVRAFNYPLVPSWGPDHQIVFYIDFADTLTTSDDQRFAGYLFTHGREAIAGSTQWNGTPFGFYAVKRSTGGAPALASFPVSDPLDKADFTGTWAVEADGWPATLVLETVDDDPGGLLPNLTGTLTFEEGASHAVRGWVRTPAYTLPHLGPDHALQLYVDFANTPADESDDRRVVVHLFTWERNAFAGTMTVDGVPHGLYGVKLWKVGRVAVPAGTSVAAMFGGSVELVFDQVTRAGLVLSEPAGSTAPLPDWLRAVGHPYDFATSASFSGDVLVTLPYDPAVLEYDPTGLRLMHETAAGWEDCTAWVDTDDCTVIGRTNGLSAFQVAEVVDRTAPEVQVVVPRPDVAYTGMVELRATIVDPSGVAAVRFSVLRQGTSVGLDDLVASSVDPASGTWAFRVDTRALDNGEYEVWVRARDAAGNEGLTGPSPLALYNGVTVRLQPTFDDAKAGRTVPVKFSLLVPDPGRFLHDEGLRIEIVGGGLTQTARFGGGSTNYRIDDTSATYITNFKTDRVPASYAVTIYRDFTCAPSVELGHFVFETTR